MSDTTETTPVLDRRRALGASLGLPLIIAGARPATAATSQAITVPQHCVLTPQAVEGPFYFDPHLERSDVTEGLPGVPLTLRMSVIEAGPCSPLPGARVDIWSASAGGEYSGYTGGPRGSRTQGAFLRGTQTTDGSGSVTFRTIYPAWYPGRTPHIHFKVFLDGHNVLMGQTYFPDALSEYLFANVSAYGGRTRPRDTFNSTDMLARMDPGRIAFCDVREAADHYLATLVVGVDRQGVVLSGGPDGAPPGGPPGGTFGQGRPPGPPPEFGRPEGPVLIVPGVSLADQHPSATRR